MSSTTTIRYQCPVCNFANTDTINVPPVDFNVEPLSMSLSEDFATTECARCRTGFDLTVQNSPSVCMVSFDEYPDSHIDADDAPFATDEGPEEDWSEWEASPKPFEIINETLDGLTEILHSPELRNGRWRMVVHMVYAHAVGALEAYLGDTLVNAVKSSPVILMKAVTSIDGLKDEKATLSEVLTTPDVVERKTQAFLRDVLYHNLKKVDGIYWAVLGVRVLTTDRGRNRRLIDAVRIRHDIVHRNGKSKEGTPVSVGTLHVEELFTDIRSLCQQIELDVWTTGGAIAS